MSIRKISVIGSGTMGNGIAHVFALHGYEVYLTDLSEELLEKAGKTIETNLKRQLSKEQISEDQLKTAIDKLCFTTDINQAVAESDLVVEAVPEKVEIKTELLNRLNKHCQDHAIIGSNTSSIAIERLGMVYKKPEQVIGMHFMNPVPIMKLVEVIKSENTNDETVETIVELSKSIDKIPIVVNDAPGFVSNRILMPMINEAIECLQQGVGGVKEIDSVMSLGMAFPMGPLKLADFIGLDVCHSILNVLYDGFSKKKYQPNLILTQLVEAGYLGRKSGKGFYDWGSDPKNPEVSEEVKKLL